MSPELLAALAGAGALALLVWGFLSLRRKRLLENVPTSKVKGVFLGLNEVKGEAECAEPLTSRLAEVPCVWYRWEVEEHWSRTETYTDAKGKTRTRTSSGWRTVDDGEQGTPFHLRDDTGAIRVRPAGAEIEAPSIFSETCGRFDPLYYGKGPARSISNSTHRRRFSESAIEVGARLYVIGPARLDEHRVVPEIALEEHAEIFLISTRSEERITRGHAWAAFFKLFFGTGLAFVAPVALFGRAAPDLGRAVLAALPWPLVSAGGYLLAVALYYLLLVYNGLVSVRERREMAFGMLDVQLQRRHDLIPRLVAVVRAAGAHEKSTQEHVAGLRAALLGVVDADAASTAFAEQGAVLRQLVGLVEDYPGLKVNANFLALQRELVDTEDRIAMAREFHNAAVTALNNRIETMPDALVARLAGFRRLGWFAASGLERTPVDVARVGE